MEMITTNTTSLFSRLISRHRPLWVLITVSVILILAPVSVAILDGSGEAFFYQGYWRPLLLSPVVIIYILVVAQWLARSETEMLRAFRPLVQIDDKSYKKLVWDASRINPVGEVVALAVGATIGYGLSIGWQVREEDAWLRVYVPVSQCLMHGMLAWTVYCSLASTRLIAALHHQPLKVDILNTKPFEPVGRHSLVTALVFVGGILLGVVFGLDVHNILSWQTWLFYIPLMSVPVLIFFMSMSETHRVLAAEKKRQLQMVTKKTHHASVAIRSRLEEGESLGEPGVEFSSLTAYEERLRAISTWPYNTNMLRTLFFTILIPLLVRALSALLFGQ